MAGESFKCSVVTPEKRILDDTVTYASIPAWDGQTGIAPGRAAMLVRLGIGSMRLDFAAGGTHYYLVQGGFAQMLGDELTILCDQAIPGENIVESDAATEYDEAWAEPAVGEEAMEAKMAALQTAREKRRLAKVVGQRGI